MAKEGTRDFVKKAIGPALGAVSAVATVLGLTGTDTGRMSANAWLGLGYVTLVLFFSRIWWIARQEIDALSTQLHKLMADVHGALETQINVERTCMPGQPTECVALHFGIRFSNDSQVRVTARIDEAGFTVDDPSTSAHESHVPLVEKPHEILLRPGRSEELTRDHAWPVPGPRHLPGWIDGDGAFSVEYGSEGSEVRNKLDCKFRWRHHPDGRVDYIVHAGDKTDVRL